MVRRSSSAGASCGRASSFGRGAQQWHFANLVELSIAGRQPVPLHLGQLGSGARSTFEAALSESIAITSPGCGGKLDFSPANHATNPSRICGPDKCPRSISVNVHNALISGVISMRYCWPIMYSIPANSCSADSLNNRLSV